MTGKSTPEPAPATARKSKVPKPPKPYPGFPLTPATCGHWARRIAGRTCYFGAWGRRVDGQLVQLPGGGEWREAMARY